MSNVLGFVFVLAKTLDRTLPHNRVCVTEIWYLVVLMLH